MVEDFKRNGEWVRSFRRDSTKINTVSGSVWNGLCARIKLQTSRYEGCTNDFLNFQDFVNWNVVQVGYNKGFELDKDILFPGNLSYSRNTCVLIPKEINNLIKFTSVKGSPYPTGVGKNDEGFRAYICEKGKYRHIGQFKSVDEAEAAYKEEKLNYMRRVAEEWKSSIDIRVYEILVNPKQLWKE